jgi:hypothetical protein
MLLDRKWEKFEGGPAIKKGSHTGPRITINRQGEIYMNRAGWEALRKPRGVALYYSREHDSIALQPANPRHAEVFPVVPKQTGYSVYAATFCRHHRIRIPNTERFLRPNYTEQGNLILNLRETVTVGGFNRKKKTRQASP